MPLQTVQFRFWSIARIAAVGLLLLTFAITIQGMLRPNWIQQICRWWNVLGVSVHGDLGIGIERSNSVLQSLPTWWGFQMNYFLKRSPTRLIAGEGWYWHGLGYRADVEMGGERLNIPMITLPAWMVIALELTLLGFLSRRRLAALHRLRASQNYCVACGYDLRQSPDRCPECGDIARKG